MGTAERNGLSGGKAWNMRRRAALISRETGDGRQGTVLRLLRKKETENRPLSPCFREGDGEPSLPSGRRKRRTIPSLGKKETKNRPFPWEEGDEEPSLPSGRRRRRTVPCLPASEKETENRPLSLLESRRGRRRRTVSSGRMYWKKTMLLQSVFQLLYYRSGQSVP